MQKTAYEVRISDWSSDVCSSDLAGRMSNGSAKRPASLRRAGQAMRSGATPRMVLSTSLRRARQRGPNWSMPGSAIVGIIPMRSEEHTSELQSLMRNSYDVFCLKQKIRPHVIKHQRQTK